MISVCINNYNYEHFLGACVDSALAEQRTSDVEVVVVDDGSTDGSRALLATYGDRVRVVLTSNGGQASAFNAGFAVARGDIVLFLDADDVLLPGACSALTRAFDTAPRPAKVQLRMAVIDAAGTCTGERLPPHPRAGGSRDLREQVRRFRSYPWPPSSANAYDAAALREVLPIPAAEYRGACDAYLSELVPYLGPVVDLDVIGVGYRRHGANDYLGTAIDVEWLHEKMARVVANHHRAVALASRLGVTPPVEDPLAVPDVALLGFRMASLRLDPTTHPYHDRPLTLGVAGVRAALANPLLSWRDRAIRCLWFALTAGLPRPAAVAVVRRFVPDTALRLRPSWMRRPDRLGRSG